MSFLAVYLFLVSLLAAGLLTPVAVRLGRRWGVLDYPGPRKIHKTSIPLTGGWALFGGLTLVLWGNLAAAGLLAGAPWVASLPEPLRGYIRIAPSLCLLPLDLYAGAAAIFLLGLADDLCGMSVRRRLVYQTLIAAALVTTGLRPNLGFLPPWTAGLIGIVWIVGITNAFNFLDGLDGLSTGVALVATSVLLVVVTMVGHQPVVTFLLAMQAGLLLGFLRYNFHPARVFLGSSGSLLIGFLLAVAALRTTFMTESGKNWLVPLLVPVFILAIPLYDTTSVVLIRLLRHRSIAIGDQNHFHHRLMRLGFSHREAVSLICLVAFAVGISAVRLMEVTLWGSVVILIQIVAILSLLVIAERVAARARRQVLDRTQRRLQVAGGRNGGNGNGDARAAPESPAEPHPEDGPEARVEGQLVSKLPGPGRPFDL
jgi:UDP-GlcNAc:undecaprenyl-phosphate GlcNAc-1-phosphate transferase